ncbi:cytochrome c oxidase assembly protein [Caulobacter segnis]
MVGAAAYAAVPLYKLFCQATGFDGTVRKAAAKLGLRIHRDRKVTIRFDANIRELPWQFQTMQASQDIRIGDTGLAFLQGHQSHRQAADRPGAVQRGAGIGGAMTSQKLECFCFSNQTIQPHQTVEFPVVYFVDPQLADDPETKDIERDHALVHVLPGGRRRRRPVKRPLRRRRVSWNLLGGARV